MNPPKAFFLILFDGTCNICHWSVQFIVPRDKNNTFCFVPLQSPLGKKLQRESKWANTAIDSVLLISPSKMYYKEALAVVMILKQLPYWRVLGTLLQLVPNSILNIGYNIISKNRLRWFGSKPMCTLNTYKNTCFKTEC